VESDPATFEGLLLPHLDAAYNLARWLAGNEHDAEDIVQEAFLRAWKFFGSFRGGNPRAWLLTIVRNAGYNLLAQRRGAREQALEAEDLPEIEDTGANPEALLAEQANIETVRAAIVQLPLEFREIIVLREMEDYSYKEIADIAGIPVGTVMSRLARGRKMLQRILSQPAAMSGRKV
jgi:RNA polymerase sigma-70 factor (ECF subfamily)